MEIESRHLKGNDQMLYEKWNVEIYNIKGQNEFEGLGMAPNSGRILS
jgi:hypothetical protein